MIPKTSRRDPKRIQNYKLKDKNQGVILPLSASPATLLPLSDGNPTTKPPQTEKNPKISSAQGVKTKFRRLRRRKITPIHTNFRILLQF